MIDFNKIKIIKKLGAGVYGTTYLVTYEGKQYAMKIQHIHKKDIKKSYKNEIWREMDLYKFLYKMKKSDQSFFVNLHGYEIIDDCTHKQERSFKINFDNKKDKWAQKIKKLDETKFCIKYLLDYKGSMTLEKYLNTHNPKHNLVYSIIAQIIKIIMLLYEGGYSHNDLHGENIMINKTDKKYFDFYGKKVKYNGYQLSAIDYGEVLHAKFKIKNQRFGKLFFKDRNEFLFNEMYYSIMNVINNFGKLIRDCNDRKKQLPWEKNPNAFDIFTKTIISKHGNFFDRTIKKYAKLFPKSEKLVNIILKKIDGKKSIDNLVKDNVNKEYFWHVIGRTVEEFQLEYPKQYAKYFGWCTWYEYIIPKKNVLNILECNNTKDLINVCLSLV